MSLFDLRPDRRPRLETFDVLRAEFVDAVSDKGVAALGFDSTSFPYGVTHAPCNVIALRAYGEGLPGVAARSAAEVTETSWVGEELAYFDSALPPRRIEVRAFVDWYPGPIP